MCVRDSDLHTLVSEEKRVPMPYTIKQPKTDRSFTMCNINSDYIIVSMAGGDYNYCIDVIMLFTVFVDQNNVQIEGCFYYPATVSVTDLISLCVVFSLFVL